MIDYLYIIFYKMFLCPSVEKYPCDDFYIKRIVCKYCQTVNPDEGMDDKINMKEVFRHGQYLSKRKEEFKDTMLLFLIQYYESMKDK